MKEYILCAAICNPSEFDMEGKLLIYCGYRHNNILWQSEKVSRNPYHQGFLTSKGRFVDRVEAAKIALEAEQIKELSYHNNQLFSEDLY
jgi:hypothetical protein